MPIYNTPLPEVDQLVSIPVINAIMEQIKQITNIPQDTNVTFVGQNNSTYQLEIVTSPHEAPVKLTGDARVIVEVDEEANEGSYATTAGNRAEQHFDFMDRETGVYLKPIYAGMDLTMTITFRTPSRSEAIRWINDARYKGSQMRSVNLHTVEYTYQLPLVACAVLKHIHSLREKQYGYGQTLEEYQAKYFTTRATEASTVTGTHKEILIRESQIRVQGVFDFTARPRRQEKNEGDGWEVTFTYTAEYHKPVEYSITYPLLVNQQTINPGFIPELPASSYEQAKRMSASIGAMYYMEAPVYQQRLTQDVPIHYSPSQDGWTPATTPQSTRMVASFMVGVEPKAGQKVLNLKDLGGFYMDPDILEWVLAVEHTYMSHPGISPLQIAVYRNENLTSPASTVVRSNGDVVFTPMAEGRKRYRVALLLTTDLSRCRPDSLKRLMAFPKAMCKIIRMTRTTTGKLNSMIGYVDMTRFLDCARTGGMSREEAIMSVVHPFTVMTGAVEAWRMEDLQAKMLAEQNPQPIQLPSE